MPFDWIMGLLGGLLIGVAAAMYLLVNGRIMGASGIVGGLVDKSGWDNWREQSALIAGLIIVPAIMSVAMGVKPTYLTDNLLLVAIAGVFVGVGTRIANGCTSGHGVCGISRLSLRGIVATLIYIGAGAVTVALFKNILGVI
jgi:uncharacterized membrane protein YedE/YeeE